MSRMQLASRMRLECRIRLVNSRYRLSLNFFTCSQDKGDNAKRERMVFYMVIIIIIIIIIISINRP